MIELQHSGLVLSLTAGQTHYFNYYWLRDNCPSSFDAQTRERVFDITELTEAPKVLMANWREQVLELNWACGHTSFYPRQLLVDWQQLGRRADSALLTRRHWYADHYPNFTRLDFHQLCDSLEARWQWARAMLEEGVALVQGMPDTDEALTQLANLLGEVRPSVAGSYFEVKMHAVPVNLSYTAAALEMHTDTPAEEMAPGIQFLHCRVNTATGGQSLFLDGAAAAADFRREHPEDFNLLAEHPVPFFYEHDDFDWRAHQRVIELDSRGDISGVTVSQHMADHFDLPQSLLDSYYPALVRFLNWLKKPEYTASFRLEAGQCIVFDNHRIVHGRGSFDPSSGDRHLRGCYIDRGELRSSYRTLCQKLAKT